MKKLVFFSLFVTLTFAQQTTSYSWEDGTGTILGSYYEVSNPMNVGATAGVNPYEGSRMLSVSESPNNDNTPQAYIAFIENLSGGDQVTASFYGWDVTEGGNPSLRIWAAYALNGDINDYQGSTSEGSGYPSGIGWEKLEHTWTIESGKEALVIQARLYSEVGVDGTQFFVDLVEVTAPNGATVTFPDVGAEGCTDPDAANYNPNATDPCDDCCEYSVGYVSIYNIQYTTDVGGIYDCYPSPYGIYESEQYVTTSGVITGIKPESNSFFIQDFNDNTYSGIYVYDNTQNPVLGSKVNFTARVEEYFGFTELTNVSSLSVISNGNSLTIKDITTGDLANGCTATGESLEGMLVRILDVSVTQTIIDDEFQEFKVDDGSGECQIDKWMYDGEEWIDPALDQEFASITGLVGYGYGGVFEILPRTMSDIVICATCTVAEAGDDQMVTPGTEVTLDGSGSYDPNGSIIAYEWTQLGGIAVILADEESAITTFTAPTTNGDLVFKLTVYDNDFNDATDEITISVGTGDSLYDIQFTTNAGTGFDCYPSNSEGEPVTVTGVITAVETVYPSFFVQDFNLDTYGGIYARSYQNTIPNEWTPVIGDEVTVSGTVSEYFGFTQLEPLTSYLVNSVGNNLEIKDITTFDLYSDPDAPSSEKFCSEEGEAVEGMLVRITNVTVVKEANEYGEWYVDDGSGPCAIDDGTNTSPLYNGDWLDPNNGEFFDNIVGVVTYGYGRPRILPRDINDFNSSYCPAAMGDVNGDGNFNILDIVTLANCILAGNCADLLYGCAADVNGDGAYNVLDIVNLAICVLDDNCGGRVDDASEAALIKKDNLVSIEANGFIGGVQMTLSHGSDFTIKMSDRALFADYLTAGNETRLLVITPETEELFSFTGEFEITEIIVANSQNEIPTSLPTIFSLSSAYPNPFNPTTTLTLTTPDAGNVTVQVYNLHGQVVSTLLSGHKPANTYSLVWDASNVPSGMYFVKAEIGGFTETQKLMLIK